MHLNLTDTHCHFYSDENSEDLQAQIERCSTLGITKVLMPNIDLDSIGPMHALEDAYPNLCKSMMGLHPTYVKESYKSDLEIIYGWFNKRNYVGVGEIGMDLYWDKSTQNWQEDAFLTQIGWAIEKNLPVSIHSRSATHEVIQLLKPLKGKVTGVFHCFSESKELADEIIKLGFYLGIGGVVTFKKAGIADVIAEIGLDRVVLETDSPYLAPTPYRGKRNEPAYTRYVADKLSELTGKSIEEVSQITQSNVNQVFGL